MKLLLSQPTQPLNHSTIKTFVDLKSNFDFLYKKGHSFWKIVLIWKISQN